MFAQELPAALSTVTVAVLVTLIGIAWVDWRQRRIPNAAVILLALLVASHWVLGATGAESANRWQGLLWSIAAFMALAVPGYGLGVLGGGDVKLMAVLTPLWPTTQYLQVFSAGVIGLVLVCLVADLARKTARWYAVRHDHTVTVPPLLATLRTRGIPLGTAMALGALTTLT